MEEQFDSYLAHHGVMGQRWGIRRYQPYPKGYTGDGKEVGQAKQSASRKEIRSAKKAAKLSERERNQKIREAQKKVEEERKQRALQEQRLKEVNDMIRRGDAKGIEKYIPYLSTADIESFNKRVTAINNLRSNSFQQQSMEKNYKKLKRALDKVGDLGNFSANFAKFFSSADTIKKSLDSIQGRTAAKGEG